MILNIIESELYLYYKWLLPLEYVFPVLLKVLTKHQISTVLKALHIEPKYGKI